MEFFRFFFFWGGGRGIKLRSIFKSNNIAVNRDFFLSYRSLSMIHMIMKMIKQIVFPSTSMYSSSSYTNSPRFCFSFFLNKIMVNRFPLDL